MRLSTFLVAATVAAVSATVPLPELTGPYPVGTVALEMIDESRLDPLAPTPQPRDLMVSLFYPTTESALKHGNYTLNPDFPSGTAAVFDAYMGIPSGTSASIVSRSYLDAPLADPNFPVLIFGPGLGTPRLLYTAQIEDLASQGWFVVLVDHTWDSLVVEFPDGRLIESPYGDADTFPGGAEGVMEIRVADVKFIVDQLSNSSVRAQVPGLRPWECLATERVGILGHSIGGATAAQSMSNYSVFAAGANFDGSMYPPVAAAGLDKPFLQMASWPHNQTNDPSWGEFWDVLRGFRREFYVNGTVHMSFTDFPALRDMFGDLFPADQRDSYGTINGTRLLDIETQYIDAFFGIWFKGYQPSILDRLSKKFPETGVDR